MTPFQQEEEIQSDQFCFDFFVKNDVQFIHSLNITLPTGENISVIGITSVFPASDSFESLLMTIEGLVAFHAKQTRDKRTVLRSIQSFSSPGIIDGLMRDIRLIFLRPDGNLIELGRDKSSDTVCRFQVNDKSLTDLVYSRDGDLKLINYDKNGQIRRTVTAIYSQKDLGNPGLIYPTNMKLMGHGMFGYSIEMRLLQTNPI